MTQDTSEQRPDSLDPDDSYGDKRLDLDMHGSRRLVHQPTNNSLGSHVVQPKQSATRDPVRAVGGVEPARGKIRKGRPLKTIVADRTERRIICSWYWRSAFTAAAERGGSRLQVADLAGVCDSTQCRQETQISPSAIKDPVQDPEES